MLTLLAATWTVVSLRSTKGRPPGVTKQIIVPTIAIAKRTARSKQAAKAGDEEAIELFASGLSQEKIIE